MHNYVYMSLTYQQMCPTTCL